MKNKGIVEGEREGNEKTCEGVRVEQEEAC